MMKLQAYTFLLLLVISLAGCNKEEDGIPPINQLSRFDGWQIDWVESDFSLMADEAVAALPDSVVVNSGMTREAIRARLELTVRQVTGVEDCERDDVLFLDDGITALGLAGEACADNAPKHVLTPFDRMTYSSDLEVTRVKFTDPADDTESVYQVIALNEQMLVLTRLRSYTNDPVVPKVDYGVTYHFTAG